MLHLPGFWFGCSLVLFGLFLLGVVVLVWRRPR